MENDALTILWELPRRILPALGNGQQGVIAVNFRRISARGLGALAMLTPGFLPVPTASAHTGIDTRSAVYIERVEAGNLRRLAPADRLMRGDRVVAVVTWQRLGGTGDFTITNPLPRAIAYQSSAHDGQLVSVDGGRSWGRLGELRIGSRMATPEDVTHIRWRVAGGPRGQIVYSGIVR
jgi:hypothetical protein